MEHARMTEDQRYFFDITGYLVLDQVLTADELARRNAAIDHHEDDIKVRMGEMSLSGESQALKGTQGRGDLGNILAWEKPWCEIFQQMLVHPRIVSVLNVILGEGFRVDHRPGIVTMDQGAEGHTLHGSSGPGFDPNQYYIFRDGKMHCGLTVVAWQLADVKPGDGGFCLIPGSHKGNVACPKDVRHYEKFQELVKPITCKAGDVVIFTEAVTHGTLPWKAKHQRRTLLIRYTAANLAYSTSYQRYDEVHKGLNEDQRAVMLPPFHPRLRRPLLDDEGHVKK